MPDIKGVEIMSLGTWNGNQITEDMFTQVCEAFEATKEFASVPLKLGHNEGQKFLQEDGLPAAGWVSKVYRQGKKLCADFSDIPTKIYELIKRKAYRKVSVELFMGYKFDGKEFPCLLGAVALLGSDLPAMATLSDILSSYGKQAKSFTLEENTSTISNIITFDIGGGNVSENNTNQNEVAELKKLVSEQAKQLAATQEKVAQYDRDKQSFEVYKSETEKKLTDLETEKKKMAVENFCLDLSKKDLLAPSMKPLVEALVGAVPTASKFSVGDKSLVATEVVEQLLTLAKEVYKINKTENTSNKEPEQKDITTEIQKKIDELMQKDQNLEYSQAYKQAFKLVKQA